jgi:hypothetical protein
VAWLDLADERTCHVIIGGTTGSGKTVMLVLAVLVAAASLPIRTWRKNDSPPVVEKHVYHEGRQITRERVLDGRQPIAPEVKLLQLPAQVSSTGVFPELLRAAYQTGALQPPAPQSEQPPGAELRELGPDDWGGDITD